MVCKKLQGTSDKQESRMNLLISELVDWIDRNSFKVRFYLISKVAWFNR